MAYRSGWARKPGQERVLAVELRREGFEWALAHASLSHYESEIYATRQEWLEWKAESPVRVQWDPERDVALRRLEVRTIQVGLKPDAAQRYVDDWVESIQDVTPLLRQVESHVSDGELHAARLLLPQERPYPLPEHLASRIGASQQ